MLEEYLQIFNDYLEVQDIDNAIKYIDKIFIDSKYLKIKNVFLYLLGCITELPEKYLDYVKTLFMYDFVMPVKNVDPNEDRRFVKGILFHYFNKASNVYYEYMNASYSIECKKALLNLIHLASEAKKSNNKILTYLFKEKDYYKLYTYVKKLVYKHPTYNNIYILYLLLQDYMTKEYFICSNEKSKVLIEQVKNKKYEEVLSYYQSINYREEDNLEIPIIIDVLQNIINEKSKITYPSVKEEKAHIIDKDMFLDFLVSVEDVVKKEGFVLLNPENETENKKMHNLTFYIPTLASYEVGGQKKQIVINMRRKYNKEINDSLAQLKKEAYDKGDSLAYIEYSLEHLKYIIPSEMNSAKLAQSYFRVGLIDEGLRALNLAMGIKAYDNKSVYTNGMLNYYLMYDYFTDKKERNLAKTRQK